MTCRNPNCPCNEPDTDIKDALVRMQERFPDWHVDVDYSGKSDASWRAFADDNWTSVEGYGPTPHAAVDAAINAWDAAVKADALTKVLKAECEAWRLVDRSRRALTGDDTKEDKR